jgi:rare lipoprotein A
MKWHLLAILVPATALAACGSIRHAGPHSASYADGAVVDGIASYYGDEYQGRPTASGERFDQAKRTAAHRTLPFDTIVRVTDPATGRSVVVRVNDRGPFVPGRVIDLSRSAAAELGILRRGIAPVTLEVLSGPRPTRR